MITPLSNEDILGAFDGDFGEVHFDHKPTADDIFLVKLKLVARKAEANLLRQIVEWANFPCPHISVTDPQLIPRSECHHCWQELQQLAEELE